MFLLRALLVALCGSAATTAAAAAELNISGCYRVDGSGIGFDKPVGGHKGNVWLQQQQQAVTGCIQQKCFSALDGDLTVTENAVGMLRLTRSGGNCTVGPHDRGGVPGFAFFQFVFPRGWAGEPTTGAFVNNWDSKDGSLIGHAGWLSLNMTVDEECTFMAHSGCMGPYGTQTDR